MFEGLKKINIIKKQNHTKQTTMYTESPKYLVISLILFLMMANVTMNIQDRLIPERDRYSPVKYYVSASVSYLSAILLTDAIIEVNGYST